MGGALNYFGVLGCATCVLVVGWCFSSFFVIFCFPGKAIGGALIYFGVLGCATCVLVVGWCFFRHFSFMFGAQKKTQAALILILGIRFFFHQKSLKSENNLENQAQYYVGINPTQLVILFKKMDPFDTTENNKPSRRKRRSLLGAKLFEPDLAR